jgi:hypothetical protein
VEAFALHNALALHYAFELDYFFAGDRPGMGSSAVGP